VKEALEGLGPVVPPRDFEALGRAMASLLADDELRRELGRRGRARILERFRADGNIDTYRRLYERLAGREEQRSLPADALALAP
jgi:glycosyltransferase involved in cell wall biosynthesis